MLGLLLLIGLCLCSQATPLTGMPHYSDADPLFDPVLDAAAVKTRYPTKRPSTRAPTFGPTTSPTNAPTSLPTSSPTTCQAFGQKRECLKRFDRCEWIQPSPRVSYGCQPRGFCKLNIGANRKQQCQTRKGQCTWTGSNCVSACPAHTPTKLASAVYNSCQQLKLVDKLSKSKAVKLTGGGEGRFGHAMAGGGADFDGDGKPDYAIGFPDLPPKTSPDRDGTGGITLMLSSGKKFTFMGVSLEGQFGASATFADLDGDGLADLVVGAPHSDTRTGEVYIIWGRSDLATRHAEGVYAHLNQANAEFAVRISEDIHLGTFGTALARAGDFNGDGIDDIVIASRASSVINRAYCGQVFVLLGNRDRRAAPSMFRIVGRDAIAYFGHAVAGGWDLNGDGYDDILVGAPWANAGLGAAYIIFGRPTNTVVDLLLDSAMSGKVWNYAEIVQPDTNSTWPNFGHSVSFVGDVNVDGRQDFAIGAPGHDDVHIGVDVGRLYVFYGNQLSPAPMIHFTQGFIAHGAVKNGRLGHTLSINRVDFNGDGYADILVGSPSANKGKGTATVIYGQCKGFPLVFGLNSGGGDRSTTFSHPSSTGLGTTLAVAGDVNGDGRSDLLLGGPSSYSQRGLVELIYSC
ncbi:hypothetical protein BASA81_003993 [Batrachochytrium salamandrivorans]|nr:hypothetical protein BASA81_003993 [Batrachochytrium salamandrivorans]